MELWHINFATTDRMPLFPGGIGDQRKALVKLAQLSGDELTLFGLVDDHTHLVTRGSREGTGRFTQRTRVSWKPLLHPSIGEAHYQPVDSRTHLVHLVSYMVRQPSKHGLSVPDALWEGSCFSDLIGARLLPGLSLGARALLPRLSDDEIFRFAGLPGIPKLASPKTIAERGPERIVAATCATVAIDALAPRTPRAQLARAAATAISDWAGISRRDLAAAMGCSTRSLQRTRVPVPDDLKKAVLLRLSIEIAVEEQRAAR